MTHRIVNTAKTALLMVMVAPMLGAILVHSAGHELARKWARLWR